MTIRAVIRLLGVGCCLAACGMAATAQAQTATVIYHDATVVTMDPAAPTAQAIALDGETILAVGSNDTILKLRGPSTRMVSLLGRTIVPGFIDAHSHMSAFGFFNDPEHWIDVSSVNMFSKPLPGDPGCKTPNDPQYCFIPVKNQDDVMARLAAGLSKLNSRKAAQGTGAQPAVTAFNYDPARLGPTSNCAEKGLACPSFENGKARATLDALSATTPIFVESESGHIAYVNTPALKALNICLVLEDKPTPGCYTPNINTEVEIKLARLGQLNEDLTFYATTHFQNQIAGTDKASLLASLRKAAKFYASRGFTLTQEGAASGDVIAMYDIVTREPDFPTTAAMLAYEATKPTYQATIDTANEWKPRIAGNPRLFIAAVKSYADGSLPGYTAALGTPYFQTFAPYTNPDIYKTQPYVGLPDIDGESLTKRLVMAHQNGYPMVVHQNGEAAIRESVKAIIEAQQQFPAPTLRDVVLHAPGIDGGELFLLNKLGNVTVSLLMDDLHYWGQPLCQQVVGPDRSLRAYPAANALSVGLHVTLHHDSPVTPPDPLFGMWTAVTRRTQIMPWYPSPTTSCPEEFGAFQRMTIPQALKAYTIDAAWQYGLESKIGSIVSGKIADLAILSSNPLDYEKNPDGLKTIKVLSTVSRGRQFDHLPMSATPAPTGASADAR